MLNRDDSAKIVPQVCDTTVWGYHLYSSGKFISPVEDPASFDHDHLPVQIAKAGENTWWMFKSLIYRENGGYHRQGYTDTEIPDLVRAALVAEQRRRQQKLRRAQFLIEKGEHQHQERSRRPAIPDDIKEFVWRRDAGKCAKCGSREDLEFDHIIPLSKGGSNTARNIQLLCQECNRSKGNAIS